MKVIITGASGFVGKNLSTYLETSLIQVRRISLRSSQWMKELQNDANAIIHLAGKAHDTSKTENDDDYIKINRDLTIELFALFVQSSIQDFFFFSSVKAAADTVEGILNEQVVANPQTAYGISKYEAERYLLSQTLPKGKRLFIIRPTMIHGPGNKGNLNLLYKLVNKNIPWPLAAFNNNRSFLSVDNLSYIIFRMLLDPQIDSGVYNVADDEPISTNQLVSLIAKSMGSNPKLWKISPKLIKTSARIGDAFSLPLNTERLKKLTESYVVSNNKIKTALGIKKLPLSAKEGLRKTIESFK